jgi:hypothetical protein
MLRMNPFVYYSNVTFVINGCMGHSGHANLLSALKQCRDGLLVDVNITDIECYRPYVLKASCMKKEFAQNDDGGHSGNGQHEKKGKMGCAL